MIRIEQLKLPVEFDEVRLRGAVASELGCPVDMIEACEVQKRSIDARGRQGVSFVLIVDVSLAGDEDAVLRRNQGNVRIRRTPDERYQELDGVPSADGEAGGGSGRPRPVIVGTGPCGLFCGLILARFGLRPILLERGKPAGERARDVTGFWRRDWPFNPESNVQFGEGGAGTFSDGKLYTQIKDRHHRIRWILRELVAAGAPEDILVKGKPHIGTDRLIRVVRHLRQEIIASGGEVRFQTRAIGLEIERGVVRGIRATDAHGHEESIGTDTVILAVGHSARDTFRMLVEAGVRIDPKPFSLGVRIEHPQALIDKAQFGRFAGHRDLGAASYKSVHHCRSGRSAYSFCMCPGGLVVAAASEEGVVVTNGMSSYARAEANANSGLMVDLYPDDYADFGDGPLAGIDYQRHWERRAFELGGGNYHAPVQRVGDFLAGRPTSALGSVVPSYLPGVLPTDLADCLPDFVTETLREAIPCIDRKLRGFALPDAVLVGVETRSSSPVRITRHPDSLQSVNVEGLYPAGEGAGYAGGIISAAVDGMRIAEAVLRR